MAHDPASAEQARASGVPEGARNGDPATPGHLTKELAHLLAASISQTQPARAPSAGLSASGTPTGAEVTSLAAMLANAQPSVRQPLPRLRDELSSLSYLRPVATPPAPLRSFDSMEGQVGAASATLPEPLPAPLGASLRAEPIVPSHPHAHVDDEPMPIPSTWREPASHDDERPLVKQLGAAMLGLLAGLVVVVPAVLWLTGAMSPARAPLAASSVSEQQPTEYSIAKVRPMDPPVVQSDATAGLPSGYTRDASVDATQQIEMLLVRARQRIEGGDIAGAREILGADGAGSAPLIFALAETYDPNMLAAWGSRGVSADVQKARALYAKALDLGYGRAMARLDALK